MLCASYTDRRLAAVYDVLNPPSDNAVFYVGLAGEAPKNILDVGCGTGRLACNLALRGHQVTGADPATAMLDIARNRNGGDRVTWIEADAASLSLGSRFEIIIMTGHVFQVFLDDEDVRAALAAIHRHLAPAGRFAFETRNPQARGWEQWTPARTRRRVSIAGEANVDVHYDIKSVDGQFVTFATHFRFADDEVVVDSTLRFMCRDKVGWFLSHAGFADVTWFGDWDRTNFGPTSPEIVVIAR